MFAVIFELEPHRQYQSEYLEIAADLKSHLETIDGFISVERFESLTQPGKLLSLSYWRDEASIEAWRNLHNHRNAQTLGRERIFSHYRLRVANIVREYSLHDREQAPQDSRERHG